MAIAPDDLVPGMFVTVLETLVERPHPFAHAAGKETFEMKEYAGSGVVLEVLAISFPFVLVRNHTTLMLPSPKVFPIDLRRTRLSRLQEEYVQAALSTLPSQKKTPGNSGHSAESLGSMHISGPFIDDSIEQPVKLDHRTDPRTDDNADNPQ
jgi:hypothetical protein